MLTDENWTNEMSIQRKTYNVSGRPYKQEIMKEEIESDVKIGDLVKLVNRTMHNSKVSGYVPSIVFSSDEIGSIFHIMDFAKDDKGILAYKVKCKKGITYLRRTAFELISTAPQPKEDLSYLIDLFKQQQIT